MDVLEAIKTRKSIRRFKDIPVENDKLLKILESIRMAPSWANMQCWRLIVVKNQQVKDKISELSFVESFFTPLGYKTNPAQKGLAEAPVIIVACADPSRSGLLWNQSYYMTDIGIAAQNLMLSAHSLGLGSVFVGVFDEEKLKGILNIPQGIRIVGIFPIGYPRDEKTGSNRGEKEAPPRKPISEFSFSERWGESLNIILS